ncbi:rab11 family-interacting protein 1 [Channa argus]|uniref:rab11 family-interacting protein 1 n=1 Tax=Channa argus TaxID=215402 RepID=UPI00352241C2
MMSLIDLDDDQRWVPTHVNVTVLRARGLRTKGKHGSRYLYTIIQVGKEKYTTGLVEKAEVPEWDEECCFELLPGILEDGGRSAYPPGSADLVLTVMHRVLIGLDMFLGQTIIPLDKIFQHGTCPRDEWFKLNSKAGRKEKERGELQVTVQFTRNNMTASMFDLTIKDKPRSAFGKLKDRVTGRKRGDLESSSAIVPGRYAALSGSLGQPFGEEGVEAVESRDVEMAEDKKSKMKDFFRGRLRKSSDTRSCSSLASESSMSSMASDNPGPPPSLDLMSDPPSSPIYTSKVRVDNLYGETDLAKKVLTSQHTTKVLTHKRAFSDEASKVTTSFPRSNLPAESLKGQTMTQSKSSLCINGSHVYDSEPSTPKSSGALQSKLVLLEKCSPLSRSLQNLTKKSEDKSLFTDGRRWSFDKTKKEEKEEEMEAQASSSPTQQTQVGDRPMQPGTAIISSAGASPEKGRKLRKTLFSGGRSDSLPAKSDLSQAAATSEGRLRGWFGSGDAQIKPRLKVSPKVESSSDVPPPVPTRSPVPTQCSSASPSGHVSPDDHSISFTPSSSPSSTPLSQSNPFLPHMQRNPFFEELIAEESQRSPPFVPCSSSDSSPFHYTTVPSQPGTPSPVHDAFATNMASIKRERPRPVARQVSLPTFAAATHNSPNHSAPRSMSESAGEWDDSFDAFASSRLNSPKGIHPQKQRTSPTSSHRHSYGPVNTYNHTQELQTCEEEPPPLPPRRLLRTPVNEISSDGWLHRGQELAVHKEAYLLSQTGVASLQRGREGECKRNGVSPDPHTSTETSDSISVHSQPCTNITSPGFMCEEKLKKFKYEPLENDNDCWGGMLFEQDLYGRMCRGTYGQPKVKNPNLSLNAEKTSGNNTTFKDSGHKMLLDGEISVTHLLNMSATTSPNPDETTVTNITATPTEPSDPPETTCINNNVSFSLTSGDLNMNVNNSDFSFIDSDCSSQSDIADTLKSINSLGRTFPPLPEDSHIAIYHEVAAPLNLFTLKDTYIPELNSSFEINSSSNKLCKVSPVCQDCPRELNNVAPDDHCNVSSREITALSSQNQNSDSVHFESESSDDKTSSDDAFKNTQLDLDNNGNRQAKFTTLNQTESLSGVVSARFRPKGLYQQSSSPNSLRNASGDKEFEQLLSLVQNISEVREGPLSYQPTKSAHSSLLTLDEHAKSNHPHHNESNPTSQVSSQDKTRLFKENCETGKLSNISFEDLHAKVAPNPRTPLKIGQSLHEPEPSSSSSSIPSALPLSADAQAITHPTPLCCTSIHPSSMGPSAGGSTTLAVAPYTSSSSYSTTSTSDQPLVDARHSLLPGGRQPANNLPHQESRPHLVKPLTSSQSEKKEGRSVLEKLKSTIHPGRSAHQAAAEAEKTPEATVDNLAQYQHLTNMELISLLLQQEMDIQKQQAASDWQGAQLEKCEAELKKVKSQVRDLEDYIDNLLLRIMEQTPTLLQVRSRHK